MLTLFLPIKESKHLKYINVPGGEQAIKEPWRMGAVYLYKTFGKKFKKLNIDFVKKIDMKKWVILENMLDKNVNSPLTSSMGRLFDAVSAICGVRYNASFEGEAAIEFERLSVAGNIGKAAFANFEVYTSSGNILLDDYISQYNVSKHILTLEEGIYYIKISTFSNDSTGYELILNSTTVINDDYSNTLDNAHPISFNAQTTGNLEVSDDIDYFRFTIDSETSIEFERLSVAGDVGQAQFANFEVYNSSGTILLQDFILYNRTAIHSLTLDRGVYYIKISTYSNNITGYQLILNN